MEFELCNDPPGEGPIHFYEPRFYWLSNFSAFGVDYDDEYYPTSEHAYQAAKFSRGFVQELNADLHKLVQGATSAHDAMLLARRYASCQRYSDWDARKRGIMKDICRCKLQQHEYIRTKLLETGTRRLTEVSPIDSFWGWGPDGKGRNELGLIWEELREELRK